jgi:hypothetical protein
MGRQETRQSQNADVLLCFSFQIGESTLWRCELGFITWGNYLLRVSLDRRRILSILCHKITSEFHKFLLNPV